METCAPNYADVLMGKFENTFINPYINNKYCPSLEGNRKITFRFYQKLKACHPSIIVLDTTLYKSKEKRNYWLLRRTTLSYIRLIVIRNVIRKDY